jgi:glycosyltransferase involved in cell wall biosynthesis
LSQRLSFTAVLTVHDADYRPILNNVLSQTRKADEVLVFVSVEHQAIELRSDDPTVRFYVVANKNDWGHEKRALGLRLASSDAIAWFNHDDSYEPTFVERMMEALEAGADIAFCNWSHDGPQNNIRVNTEFRGGDSTSGNWVGRTGLIRSVGYVFRDYSADASLINAIVATKPLITKIDMPLYHHNP